MKYTIGALILAAGCAGTALAQTSAPVISDAYKRLWDDPATAERIEKGIRENRMAEAALTLPSIKTGTDVTVEQTRHAFLFGGNSFLFGDLKTPKQNRRYAETFGTLFNAATVAFYWKTLEKWRRTATVSRHLMFAGNDGLIGDPGLPQQFLDLYQADLERRGG